MSLEKSSIECNCRPYRGLNCRRCYPTPTPIKEFRVGWLDKHIAQQAAYYGLSVEAHGQLIHDAAQYDEDNPHL